MDKTSRHAVMIAAGMGYNGTAAASEMLTDARQLAKLESALHVQPGKNFEAVIRTRVVLGKSSPGDIVASEVW